MRCIIHLRVNFPFFGEDISALSYISWEREIDDLVQSFHLRHSKYYFLTLCISSFVGHAREWWDYRQFQTSDLKNHEFQFFTTLPTKPSSYAVVHQQPWACAKPTELKTFVHQDFHGIHLGTFGGISNHHISKTTNFIFSQNSPPSHLAMSWCTDNLGHVQNPQNSKLSCTNTFKVFIWGHSEAFPSITSQKPRISFFSENSPPSYLAVAWCTDQLGHVQNPPNLKLSCTKTFMVFIWGHLEAFPTLISQKPRISFFHKTPHQAI